MTLPQRPPPADYIQELYWATAKALSRQLQKTPDNPAHLDLSNRLEAAIATLRSAKPDPATLQTIQVPAPYLPRQPSRLVATAWQTLRLAPYCADPTPEDCIWLEHALEFLANLNVLDPNPIFS